MIHDQTIDRLVSKKLVAQNKKEREAHTPSGKLSASILGNPLQWQILKVIGVPQKDLEPYTLRLFQRGRDVEDWFIKQIDVVDSQKDVEYRGVVGIMDALIDTTDYEFNLGEVPNEIKSVKGTAYKWIEREGEAKP